MPACKHLRLLAFLLTLFLLCGAARADDDAGVVNLSRDLVRLGIAARNLPPDDPTFDARPLFEAAVQFARRNHTRLLTADRGSYFFLTPQDQQSYLRFAAVSDLTVDLEGSKIFFANAFLQGFAVANSSRVTLTDFSVDFVSPPFTQVELVAVDPVARSLTYRTLPGWVDPVTFNGASVSLGGSGQPSTPLVLWAAVFRDGDILPGTSRMHVAEPISASRLDLVQDNTPWTQAATLATLRPGDTIVVTERGGPPPVIAFNSDHITFSHLTVHGSSAIAVILTNASHSLVDDVQVRPRRGALISSNADGIHFSDVGPDNHIRRSFVTRTLDDALAMESLDPALVVRQAGPRQVTVRRTNNERFPDGTSVNFVDLTSALEIPGATIIAQDPPDTTPPVANGLVDLTFDRDLPALAAGFGMTFADRNTRGAGSSIEDNRVEDILFGRGAWIGGAVGVTVARNRIGHTSNGGITVSQDTIFFPGPPAHDIVIEDNLLRGSLGPMASGSGSQIAVGAIIVDSSTNTQSFSPAMPNTNISIRRNVILDSGRSGIWVGELDGATIEDNVIRRFDQHPELPLFGVSAQTAAQLRQDFTQALVVRNSRNVTVEDNAANPDQD